MTPKTRCRRYLDGPAGVISMATSSATFYYHHDPLGSTSDLTDATGSAQWAYSYEPYGATLTATNVSGTAPENRLRFTSQYADTQTGTYHLHAREYDPTTGRFGGLDPLGGALTSPADAPYTYVGGQPTLLTDPLGLCKILDCFKKAFEIVSKALGEPVHTMSEIVDVAFAKAKAEVAQAAKDAASAAANSNLLRATFGFEPTNGDGGLQYKLGMGIGLALMFFAPEIRAAELLRVVGAEREALAGIETAAGADRALSPLVRKAGEVKAIPSVATTRAGGRAAEGARGLSPLGGVIEQTRTNAAGGRIFTSTGAINQNDFAGIVNSGLMRGEEVHILTGVHGLADGSLLADPSLLVDDVGRFGGLPGVFVHDLPSMSPDKIRAILKGPGTIIGGFCDSGACLAPYGG